MSVGSASILPQCFPVKNLHLRDGRSRYRETLLEYIHWLGTLTDEEAIAHLTGIEGIGRDSATTFLKNREEIITSIERHPTSMIAKNRVLHAILIQQEGEFKKRLLSRAALADEPVTTDTKRLIRMPTSLHGGSGMRVQPLELRDLQDFEPLVDAVVFSMRDVRVDLIHAVTIPMLGSTYELQKGINTVPGSGSSVPLLPWHGGNQLKRRRHVGPMGLDDLRIILLSERETGRLTAVAPDLFDRGHTELASLISKVYAFEDPLSEEARSLIEETLAIKETLRELFALRSRKILALTIMHAEGNYYDREEVKRMVPVEKEMFETVTASIEQCKGILLHNVPHRQKNSGTPETVESDEPEMEQDEDSSRADILYATPKTDAPLSPQCVLVRVLEDMESFMGIDGRIYTLSKGDIVTLPERNAAVLSERNIVLNMNLCK